ncbi:MAG TPA: sporulation transcriptional regulator SpoIIID [Tenericutes bacterium]|jgi:putative DeoR family transcriptional regulator (stage III sporulation protein D)|nr:sporulation transcriptional regulator SpoIIID [Mycoplasmatota bacterium]
MNPLIHNRVLEVAYYVLDTKKTVREVAPLFKVSKSTIHKDLTYRLPKINEKLYQHVKKILNHHKEIRHIRGGEATKRKYLARKNNYTK